MATPESIVKKQICEYLTRFHSHHCFFWVQESVGIYDAKRGIYRKKNSPWQIRGISDILGVWKRDDGVGLFFGIEVKVPTSNRVSEHQAAFIKAVREMGGRASVCKSVDDVVRFIKSDLT